ncbi:hypothetical protein [Fusobacterium varium]
MEMKLFKKGKERWTRFKVGVKEIQFLPIEVIVALGYPIKKSSRFYYFEKKGDYLNERYL